MYKKIGKMVKQLLCCCAMVLLLSDIVSAQNRQVLLFPDGAPGEKSILKETGDSNGGKVGGQSVLRISGVGAPTITIYPSHAANADGAAILVCPGGGYEILAYDLEGTEICEWLNEIGVTAVLLKYRVPRREGQPKHLAPLQDAQRAIGYIRSHADELKIDPNRLGIMGFSAGAHLSAMVSNNYLKRAYPHIDEMDTVNTRPNFCALIYPAYLSGENFSLAPDVKVSRDTPPTFLVQAEDDKSFINSSLFYYYALKELDVPVSMHLYPKGGHGYGLRDTGAGVNVWPKLMEAWLVDMGIIKK